MEWSFKFLPEHGVLSLKATGDLDYDTVIELIAASAAEMQRHDCNKILVDYRDAVLRLSPTRVYRLPAVEVAHGLDRRHKVAVVLSPSTIREDDAKIYADAIRKNSQPHRLFDDPDTALAWLLDRESSER